MKISTSATSLVLALSVLLFAACPNSGSDGDSAPQINTSQTAPPAQKPATGWTGDAMDFAFRGFNGSQGKVSDFAGKPLVVNFWATW